MCKVMYITCIHLRTSANVYRYTHAHIYMYIYICMHILIFIHICKYVYTFYTPAHEYRYIHTRTLLPPCTHTRMQTLHVTNLRKPAERRVLDNRKIQRTHSQFARAHPHSNTREPIFRTAFVTNNRANAAIELSHTTQPHNFHARAHVWSPAPLHCIPASQSLRPLSLYCSLLCATSNTNPFCRISNTRRVACAGGTA